MSLSTQVLQKAPAKLLKWVGGMEKPVLPIFAICVAAMFGRPMVTLSSNQPKHIKQKTAAREFLNEFIALPTVMAMTLVVAPLVSRKIIKPRPEQVQKLLNEGKKLGKFTDDVLEFIDKSGVQKITDKAIIDGLKQSDNVSKTVEFISIIGANCLIPQVGNAVIEPMLNYLDAHVFKTASGKVDVSTEKTLDIVDSSISFASIAEESSVTSVAPVESPVKSVIPKNITASSLTSLVRIGG